MLRSLLTFLSILLPALALAQSNNVPSFNNTAGGDFALGSNWNDGRGPIDVGDRGILGNNTIYTGDLFLDSVNPLFFELDVRNPGSYTFRVQSGGSLDVTSRIDFENSGAGTGVITFRVEGGSVNAGGVLFNTSGGTSTLEVDSGSVTLGSVSLGNASAASHVFRVSGGNVAITDPTTGLDLSNANSTFEMTGGTLDLQNTARFQLASTTAANFTWTGGTMTGVERFQGSDSSGTNVSLYLNDGGTLLVNGISRVDDGGSYAMGAMGRTVFQINSDGSTDADLATFTGGQAWDLTNGTVLVDFGSYTPQINDSWDFSDLSTSQFLASTGNVSSTSADGLWEVTWDLSSWQSAGQLSVLGVVAVPEPSTGLLFLGSGLGWVLVQRRSRRKV